MKIEGEQVLLRFLVDSKLKYEYIFPLYRHIVAKSIKENVAGLTVVQADKGFISKGGFGKIYLLEIVDLPERLNLLLEKCANFIDKLIFTTERAYVYLYISGNEKRLGKRSFASIISTANESRKKEVFMGKMKEEVLIRIFIGDSDRDKMSNKYLYDLFIEKAREMGFIAGLMYKGVMGFGKAGRIRAVDTVELSKDLPVIVEVIGDESKVSDFLSFCDEHVQSGLVTLEKLMVYRGSDYK